MSDLEQFPIDWQNSKGWKESYSSFQTAHTTMPDGSYVYAEYYPHIEHPRLQPTIQTWQLYSDESIGRYVYNEMVTLPTESDWDAYNRMVEEIAPEIPGVDRKQLQEDLAYHSPAKEYKRQLQRATSEVSIHYGSWMQTLAVSRLDTDPVSLNLSFHPPQEMPLYKEDDKYYRNRMLRLYPTQSHISAEYDRTTGDLLKLKLQPETEWSIPPQTSENPTASLVDLANSLTSAVDIPDYFTCVHESEIRSDSHPLFPGQRDQGRAFLMEAIMRAFPDASGEYQTHLVTLLSEKHGIDWAIAKNMGNTFDETFQTLGNLAEKYLYSIAHFGKRSRMKTADLEKAEDGFHWTQTEWQSTYNEGYYETPDLPSGIITNDNNQIDFSEGFQLEVIDLGDILQITCYATNRKDKVVQWKATIPQKIPVKQIESILWDPLAYIPKLKDKEILPVTMSQ